MKLFANQINREIFNNNLDISEISFRLKKKEKSGARAWFFTNSWDEPFIELIESCHDDEFEVFHSIAHELIHYYQWKKGLFVWNHNTAFFRHFKKLICDFYEIEFNKEF